MSNCTLFSRVWRREEAKIELRSILPHNYLKQPGQARCEVRKLCMVLRTAVSSVKYPEYGTVLARTIAIPRV